MVTTRELTEYITELLQANKIADYCPNGLQVQGKSTVTKIVTGVTANQALLDAAVVKRADAILVHHGYFWKNEPAIIQGSKRKRLATLLQHDVNLLAYHLPLDVHPHLGNNAQLAKALGFLVNAQIEIDKLPGILWLGELPRVMTGNELAQHLTAVLGRQPLHIEGDDLPKRIAWCTGAAQRYIEQAFQLGANTFITGEVSETTVDFARENGMHFYAAGHYATECYGIRALGEHVAEKFQLQHEFVAIENPV